MSENWYQLSVPEVLRRQGVERGAGLGTTEATSRLAKYGPNELQERGGREPLKILLEQLTGILTLVLIAAAVVSFFLGDILDAIVILAIVVLNAVLGFTQEYRAEKSIAALKKLAVPVVRVRRNGQVAQVSAIDLVPGDIVILETGNVVPADGRVVESVNMRAMEAALTGESEAVEKEADLVFETEKALGDRRNIVYSGTVINYGRGEMIVTGTGMQTELGKIADLLQSVIEDKTPLQKRLDRLGKQLAIAALGIVTVIFIIGVARGNDVEEMLLSAVSLAVAAVPEALTAVVTIALSLGAQRMLKRRALIRKLPAVETLGSVNVICSDKTGTLTQNRMTVTAIDIAHHKLELVQKQGAAQMELVPVAGPALSQEAQITLNLLMLGGAVCNDATLAPDPANPGVFHAVGDPTEGALILAAANSGLLKEELDNAMPRVAEYPFDSTRKRMTTVHRMPRSDDEVPESLLPLWQSYPRRTLAPEYMAFTKGAVDGMLAIADRVWVHEGIEPLDDAWRSRLMAAHDALAGNGMRVLGVGMRRVEEVPTFHELPILEERLVLVGLFGMIDPPRPEVRDAVATCRTAGIRAIMITGDHPLTARHIARQLGIAENDRFLTGQELDTLDDQELDGAIRETSVFARVSPEHKLRLVNLLQRQGQVVAMTGDGVNDAPALKKADIGVAMGITGTDVSKEAAEMVLLDDNFATIVSAVEEGRTIYDNIRRFIKYLLSCNVSEIAVMLIGPFLGMPIPLLPLQILWMNLVTDGLPALALGVEPPERNVMKRKPYSSSESIFGRGMVPFIAALGVVMSLVALVVGVTAYRNGDPAWQSLLFTTLIFCQLMLALEVRSEVESLFRIGLLSNRPMLGALVLTILLQAAVLYIPFFQRVFGTQPLPLLDVGVCAAAGLAILAAAEIWKAVVRARK